MHKHDITYFLSDKFDYKLLICADAGPIYASAYGWDTSSISSLITNKSSIKIIDNRIDPSEFLLLIEALEKSESLFLLQVVDTYSFSRLQPYLRFLLSLKPQKNLFFLSPYQAEEAGKDLVSIHGLDHFIHIPYAYSQSREIIDLPLKNRSKRVIVSGSMTPTIYPFRSNFHSQTYHKLWSLFKTKYLPHPNYRDVDVPLKHKYIGDNYIYLLSKYRFMLLCPGILHFEFLKYSECAYAGCVPVGKKPLSFNNLPAEYFFEIDENNIRYSLNKLFQIPYDELEKMASSYRNWMRKNRNPEHLNKLLLSQLDDYL